MKKTLLCLTMTASLGGGMLSSVQAAVSQYDWSGMLTMLDSTGAAIVNSSISVKGNNQFLTPVSGTLNYDVLTGAGTATVSPFDFFSGTLPAEVTSFDLQGIGDGMGGAGPLILGNMLFQWGGNADIPVSMVFDASGFLAGELAPGGGASATPASDGTYVGEYVPDTVIGPGGYAGYLGLGPVPFATTAWNSTCMPGDTCTPVASLSIPGVFDFSPLYFDDAGNVHDYTPNTGGDIGGSPMVSGPFAGSNMNFNIVSMTPAVPVPAAVWLFGSGLLALSGIARRR